jgi:hypothetical protein
MVAYLQILNPAWDKFEIANFFRNTILEIGFSHVSSRTNVRDLL